MTNAELIKALRYCADEDKICTEQTNCGYYGKGFFCQDVLMLDAADALEAADKRIARLEEDLKTREAEREVMQDTIKVCEKRISELEEELLPKSGEWISVEDRLPTEKGAYLTAYYDGYVCENEWHFIGETAVGWVNDGEAVRYWMELPEPPNCGAKMRGEQNDC